MLSLVLRTLSHFRSLLFPVVLGVAVASAVIVGALLVGDSMRGSLRFIAMDRIGDIESVVVAPRWFDERLNAHLQQSIGINGESQGILLIQSAIAELEDRRAADMALFGVDEPFWKLGSVQPKRLPNDEEVILNESLANQLAAKVGDAITLRVATQAVVPADSPLGKREQDTTVLPRWKVIEILPDCSLARFSLRSDQRPIQNAFVTKSHLQSALSIGSQVNSILVKASQNNEKALNNESQELLNDLSPALTDLGLAWQHVQRTYPDDSLGESSDTNESKKVLDYYHLTSDQMLLTDKLMQTIVEQTRSFKPQVVMTYLANGIEVKRPGAAEGRNVPYSTISAVDWSVVSEMLAKSGNAIPQSDLSQGNWAVITQWLADECKAEVGDELEIAFYLPETVEGTEVEESFQVRVAAIAPLTEPQKPFTKNRQAVFAESPTPFNDPAWTPIVPGITDQDSISKWDTPFPLTRKIENRDDRYWNSHRLTPKIYVSLELGQEKFGSRFGRATSIRFDGLNENAANEVEAKITQIAREQIETLGWRAIPLRQQQLRAASGTTPFDALFLSLSFFVIVAALLLVMLLFRLAIEQRADHWGLLMAAGWTRASVRRLLLLEGSIVCALGATLGVLFGMGYAYLMIAGLRSWWLGAITVSFLDFYISPRSLIFGWLLGWASAIVTILISTHQFRSIQIAKLLKKQMDSGILLKNVHRNRGWLVWGIGLLAAVLLLSGRFLQGQAQAGAFVGAGMLFLIAGLAWVLGRLKTTAARHDSLSIESLLSASTLAASNAKRAPFRSILAIGLVAVASFLILSMSLFQAAPNESGTGGFAYLAKCTTPIHYDLANADKQQEILGSDAKKLSDVNLVPIRVRGGDDASCNNLYQANQPQVLGISPRMNSVDRNADGRSLFAWFANGALGADETPWKLLEQEATGTADSPMPVVLDQNTALWALHLGGYVGEKFSYTFDDEPIHFVTVGVLQNTILQGSLLLGEANFEKAFPAVTGYRMYLIKPKSPAQSDQAAMESVKSSLENGWSESGMSLASTNDILKQLLAVQNTYLGAFQVLGALGLLLGTIGLGVAQLRSAIERRSELAAMRAIGFTKSRLVWLLTLENGWQLIRGIGIGVAAAGLATLPALLEGQPFHGLVWPAAMMMLVAVTGIACSILAAWLAMRWPLLSALRSDK